MESDDQQKTTCDDQFEKTLEGGYRSPFNPPLYIQRYAKVKEVISQQLPLIKNVADLGTAEGGFLRYLRSIAQLEKIIAVDLDGFSLEEASFKVRPVAWDYIFGRSNHLDIYLYEGDILKPDYRLVGIDAISAIEFVEHLYPDMVNIMVNNIFGIYQPRLAVITTPNRDYNLAFGRPVTKFRHPDHKFEWTRKEFTDWCNKIVEEYPNYSYETTGVGDPPPQYPDAGYSSQIAIFKRSPDVPIKSTILNEDQKPFKLFQHHVYEKSSKPQRIPNPEEDYCDWDCGDQLPVDSSDPVDNLWGE